MASVGISSIMVRQFINVWICSSISVSSNFSISLDPLMTHRLSGAVTEEQVRKFTHVVFITLYPFIMFDNLYGKNIADNMDMRLGLYAVGFTALQFALSWAFVVRIEKDDYERGAMIQAIYSVLKF